MIGEYYFCQQVKLVLSQHMLDAGKKAKAGQEMRLVDIPADAGKSFGLFEVLHGFESSAALSKALMEASTRYYGTAAQAFLEQITESDNFISLSEVIKKLCQQFLTENLPPQASGQVHRVCERFALIAVAGELATHYGITGWQSSEAEQAAVVCFKAWLIIAAVLVIRNVSNSYRKYEVF